MRVIKRVESDRWIKIGGVATTVTRIFIYSHFSTWNNRIEYKERHVKYGRIKGDRMKHDSDVNRFSEHAAAHIQ